MDLTLIEFLSYVKTAGGLAAPIFAILFWLERNERQDAQRELKEVTSHFLVVITEFKALLDQLTTIFGANNNSSRKR